MNFHYAILQNPGHNRVYYNLAGKLALAELKIAVSRLSHPAKEVTIQKIAGVRYLTFSLEGKLNEEDLILISRLSFFFALYEIVNVNGGNYLNPIQQAEYHHIDEKISSLMKYQGKTNELFTRMMINVAMLSSDFENEAMDLLDPVSGKGTTLFEALVYGMNAYGVELDPNAVHEAATFFKKYIEAERFKHNLEERRIAGANKAEAVFMKEFSFARSKEEFKNPAQRRRLGTICGSTTQLSKYFKKRSFHLIVGDLPYGISHGNTAGKHFRGGTRNPAELLEEALPQWKVVLKPGGTIVVAWNSFTKSRKALAEIFETNGLEVFSDELYCSFEHMVDKSIKRDILVAKKV